MKFQTCFLCFYRFEKNSIGLSSKTKYNSFHDIYDSEVQEMPLLSLKM